MLRNASCFKRVIIRCGKTDLRRGITGLVSIIRLEYGLDPLEEGTLFLFCGNKRNSIKGICFDKDGWCMIVKKQGGRHGHHQAVPQGYGYHVRL